MSKKVKVADYIINFFGDRGVADIFMLYGAANGHLVDGFTRAKNTRYIATMHEQGAGFAAECYSKTKKVPGVALVTSGPGAHNLVTSVANCFYDSVPAIFLTGQINTNFMRPDPEIRQVGFQESDIVSIVTAITKYAHMINSVDEVVYTLEKAWHTALEGRPGPVLLDIPINIQEAYFEPDKMHGFNPLASLKICDLPTLTKQINGYLDDLERSSRPVLLVGGGVRSSDCIEELTELMDILKIPAYVTWNALDIVRGDSEWYAGRIGTYGGPGRNLGIQNTDLLFAVGSRVSGRITGGNISTFAREAKKYIVDVDGVMLQPHLQQVPFDVNMYADLKLFLPLLIEEAKKRKLSYKNDWHARCSEWKVKYDSTSPWMFNDDAYVWEGVNRTHPYALLRDLGALAPKDTIFVGDLGGVSAAIGHALELHGDQLFQTNNGNAPMGFAFAAAIGAKIAAPDREVIAIIGDGGMNINIQELQTLINYGVSIKTIILNNQVYGITKAFQETNFEGRMEACGPIGYNPPDFVRIADAYGVAANVCRDNASRVDAIRWLLSEEGPAVLDVDMCEYHVYEPRIFGWSTPIEDMYPYLPREELQEQLYITPHETFYNPAMPGDNSKTGKKSME
jgi:acetolactate synthase-1/2/3 large subunit